VPTRFPISSTGRRHDADSRSRAEFERFRPVDPAVLQRLSSTKYGDPPSGWGPATRRRFGYYTPEEVYESVLERLITAGCRWLDVGCGREPLPGNPPLAKELSARCSTLVGVDPDPAIHENLYAHRRVQGRVEQMDKSEFDVITARMVVEHVSDPRAFVKALRRLCGPNGAVVIYTVNRWAPVSIASSLIPFSFHQSIINFLWGTGRETFPVEYRMNTRGDLAVLMREAGFQEGTFTYLDDCRTFGRFRLGNLLELLVWKVLNTIGLHYPETCLLGIYRRADQ
jgi:2-polyprenyl-3-methyl-5-hydroxy-6-metoxy-1,4-benzoquinol methylase